MSSLSLAAQQNAFIDLLLDESQPVPTGWGDGRFAIYRSAYRARLIDAVRDTYPRTERWVGEEAFRRAAAHHVIQHPPQSWTLDTIGKGFPDTVADLFSNDPEVSELAWVEWMMHECFVSADQEPIDAAGFQAATATFEDDDWANMVLTFLPGTQVSPVHHQLDALWRDMAETGVPVNTSTSDYHSTEPLACVVWRRDLVPTVCCVSAQEGQALAMMLDGASYGDTCRILADEVGPDAAIEGAGAMLGRWIQSGQLASISLGQ